MPFLTEKPCGPKGNALAKKRYRSAAIELLEALTGDPNVEIVPLSEQLYERAFRLFKERPDKEWGLGLNGDTALKQGAWLGARSAQGLGRDGALEQLPGLVPERPLSWSRLRCGAKSRSMVAELIVRSLARAPGKSSISPWRSRTGTT